MDFLTNEYSFKSASGLCDIYAQSASPADYGSVKGVVQITHGMAEHSNRYGRFAVELCKNVMPYLYATFWGTAIPSATTASSATSVKTALKALLTI